MGAKKRRREVRRAKNSFSSILLLFCSSLSLSLTPDARALVWPDVAEKVERDLTAADPATRREAARQLASLGPSRGAPLAVNALGDGDDEVRLAAADSAIRLRAAGATDVVVGWMNAPDARLRKKACDVARVLPSPLAVAPLARTLGDPDQEVRAAAAEALGHQASADAVPPLLGRLDDPAPTVRIQIVSSLARLGDTRAVVPLVGRVHDSSNDVRESVVRALGDLGDARASSALIVALRDQTPEVKRDALAALGRLHAADAVDAIAPFASDRTPSLRLAALGALGRIATADAVRTVVGNLGTGDDAMSTLERTPERDALVTAGQVDAAPQGSPPRGRDAVVPALHTLLAGAPSAETATSAAWVLGEMHATAEAPTIVGAMRRGALPTPAALHALAGAGTAAEVPIVLEFVADPSPVVRDEALRATAALLDPNRPDGRAVEPLAAALRDARPSADERARIAKLLGRTGAPRAAPVLIDLVHAHDAGLKLAAVDALGTLGLAPVQAAPAPSTPSSSSAPGSGTDDALLDVLASNDPTLRLHAAVALAEAGGARAREKLVEELDGGDEVDRSAVLTALGGVLARVPTDAAIAKLAAALELSAGPERDAIIEAIGRAPSPAATRRLAASSRAPEPADRRAVAGLLAAHGGDALALATARAMLGDGDASVRAQAAWTLGTIGDATDIPRLEALTHGDASTIDAAVDAAAAMGRVAARVHAGDAAARALCPLVAAGHAYVRANALAALALAGARCEGGESERRALAEDGSEEVRAAAALALARTGAPEDVRALERCSRADPSGAVANRCRTRPAAPTRSHAALVFVIGDATSAAPRPGAPFAMLLADGTLRTGTTDRRGAAFDPVAPEGEVSLRPPSALAR
jgi:HEAT repeat protein